MKRVLLLLTTLGMICAACTDNDNGDGPAGTATATATAAATMATPKAATTTAAGTPAPSNIAALNGLRCVGLWRNATFGSTGAFAARLEVGGAGGALSLELGGNVFGGEGGVTELPFRQVGNELEIEAHSAMLGHVSARIGLDGRATGSLQGTPALGPRSNVTLTNYSFANKTLRFGLDIDFGDGRPHAMSMVEAACSR